MLGEKDYEKDIKITLVESDIKANYILKEILNGRPCIIGVDTEAALEMSRFGILCLIQVIYYISVRLLSKSKFLFLI